MSGSCETVLAESAPEQDIRSRDGRDRSVAPAAVRRLGPDAPRMVIVEDAPLIALDLAETMRGIGFDVRATAFTHEQALAEIDRVAPQYAIVALHLGSGEAGLRNGEAVLRLLDQRGCRCLVFSGDDEGCRRVAERYPHFPVLSKPARPDRLIREIQKLRALDGR